ncbi:hypothetical protein Patl1_05022 [Pistacia atlantica]|uniref:Uncharacterized protein n=1 Tax=Pistacia atlantica TaxID=434234 RepID=A0ACC1BV11_9ROSI|nr:hypothetical protein Patl1_05022 [Pistacia atlantica]
MSFECTSYLIFELVLCNLSSLADACIDVTVLSYEWQEFPQRAIELLGGIHHVKSLTLWSNTLDVWNSLVRAFLPTFHNLTHLRIPWCWGLSDDSDQYTTEALMHFLQKLLNLEYLEIPGEFDPESEWSSIVPQCIKFCLKTVRILHLKGSDTELIWLKYFLGNTNVLERVTILCSESLQADSEKQKKINNEVQAIRKGLVSCVVEFL